MKKTLLLSLFLLAQIGITSVLAQTTVTVPEAGKVYTLKHAGLYLTRSLGNEAPIIKLVTLDIDQQFQFVPVAGAENTYNILNVGYDEYLARKDAGNAWTMFWVADPNAPSNWANQGTVTADSEKIKNAQFQIVPQTDATYGDYVIFKNVAGNGYFGTDANSDGETVYANKGETEYTKSVWYIAEASDEVDKTLLQDKYNEALVIYSTTTVGTGSDQYPAATRAALEDALEQALDVLEDDGAFIEDVNDALSNLTTKLNEYKASVYPFLPSTTATYYIQHSSGFYFTGNSIANPTYAADQQFKFVSAGGQWYNIQQVTDPTKYLTRQENGYSLDWGTDGTTGTAQFVLRSTGTGFYTIQCAALTGNPVKVEPYWFIGTDNNTAGSGAYVDKDGTDGKHYWKIVDITTVDVIKTALEEAVAKATEFLQYAVAGEGADQYPAAEYNALTAAKTAAEAVIANDAATQQQVSDATLALNNALAAAIAAVKPFNPDVTEDYSIVHYGGLFFNALDYEEGSKANAITIAAKSQADNQKIKFVATDVADAYNITIASVPGKYLTRCTDPHATEADKFDDYKLIWADEATSPYAKFEFKRVGVQNYYTIECITAGPQRTLSYAGTDATTEASGVSIDKNGTSTNHYWRIVGFTETGLKPVNTSNVFVSSNNGYLKIGNLEGRNKIAVYNITGQLIFTAASTGAEFEKQLPQGLYIVAVTGETLYKGKAIVK
jgi:hypothetical protein